MERILVIVWLLWLGVYDIRYKKVPVWLVAIGFLGVITGLGYSWWSGSQRIREIVFGMFPGFVLLGIAMATKQAGWIDGVIVMLLGAAIGWRECFMAVMLGLLLLSVFGLGLLLFKRVSGKTKIPFVPFLLSGYVLAEMISG